MAQDPNVMGWDDVIEEDGQQFIIIKEGDYTFEVTNFERGTYNGSARIPKCNKATLTLAVQTPEGTAFCKTDLVLYKTLEWKLSQFFRSIGQKKHGEKLVMNWSKVVGSTGRAHFKPRKWTGNDGVERESNDVDTFLEWDGNTKKNEAFTMLPPGESEEDMPF